MINLSIDVRGDLSLTGREGSYQKDLSVNEIESISELLKGNLTISVAQSREAYYAYQRTILTSVSEVVSSLKGMENYRAVADLQTQEVNVLRQTATTSNELFANGYATYLEVITA